MTRARGLAALVVLYAVIALIPPPATITPQGWRQTAIFICVIAGMVTDPVPASALVLMGLTAMAANGTPMREVLGGYAEPSVWLVFIAVLIAKMMLDCGLARRIALLFVRLFGSTSIGIAYALQMTDVTLASGVPSITARSAGMVLPVARSIAELFDSRPNDGTEKRLGTYLIATMYQGSAVACAMFMTGQASNLLGASLALKLAGVEVTWASWFVAAIVPGLLSCAIVPWICYKCLPPEIQRTPEASTFAATELVKMGRMSRDEMIVLFVFAGVGLMWMTSAWHHLDVTLVALVGISVLLVTGTMSWTTASAERSAWDLITWYYGLPTSSSHALIGAYAGAAVAKVGQVALIPGGWTKTLIFIVLAPGIGFVLAFVFMVAILWIFRGFAPSRVDRWFRRLQLLSAAAYSLGHGANDAQKTMGIIAGALFAGGYITEFSIPFWVEMAAYTAISLGTLSGGWRIIHTMGSKITRLQPVGGFAAETAGAISLFTATAFGVPVSTTHTITGAIVGVGSTRRLSAVRWGVAGRIVWAWILTIPASAGIAAATYYLVSAIGLP